LCPSGLGGDHLCNVQPRTAEHLPSGHESGVEEGRARKHTTVKPNVFALLPAAAFAALRLFAQLNLTHYAASPAC
jgi:hypothetical protein